MSEVINHRRRRFLGTAAAAVAAADLVLIGSAAAQSGNTSPIGAAPNRTGTVTSFAALKQIAAGELNVGYAEAGPANGPPVILLHGWPYDIHSFVEVAPMLAAEGYRVIVPYVRGCGTTRFLSDAAFRNGQQAAVATDVINLMDALKIEKATVAGFDWGTRSACIVAALWPERCKALVAVSGYGISNPAANKLPLPPEAEHQWWYQYYFATDRGVAGYDQCRHDFGKLIWKIASPKWNFDDATFDRTAASFNNPDYVAIVIHERITAGGSGLTDGDRRYDAMEQKIAEDSRHRRAVDLPRRRCQRGATFSGRYPISQEIRGQICVPCHHGRNCA